MEARNTIGYVDQPDRVGAIREDEVRQALRAFIEESGIQYKRLAANIGCDQALIHRAVSGKIRMTLGMFLDICAAMAVNPARFLQ